MHCSGMIQFTLRNEQAKEGEDAEIEVIVYDYLVNHHSKVNWFPSQKEIGLSSRIAKNR